MEKLTSPQDITNSINSLRCLPLEEITPLFEQIANSCRDETQRTLFTHPEFIPFLTSYLHHTTNQELVKQVCRCIVNLTYFNPNAREILATSSLQDLRLCEGFLLTFPDLRFFILNLYINVFESSEALQDSLVTADLAKNLQTCLEHRETLIQLMRNITSLEAINIVFNSPFFTAFLQTTPLDLANEECSTTLEFLRSLVSYTMYQQALAPAMPHFFKLVEASLHVVNDPTFPKNIPEDVLSQVCLSIKTVFDFYDDFYQYQKTQAFYADVLLPFFEYATHGDLFSTSYVPAPTQNHAFQILCHAATIDMYLPFFFRNRDLIERIVFETPADSKLMEIQRHAIGIMQSFSTNEDFAMQMVESGVLDKMARFFTEEGMMNQPLIYRCLCILQNLTTLYPKKDVFLSKTPLSMIILTFKHVSNLVIRYAAVHSLKNIIHENPTTFDILKDLDGVDCFLDVCMGKDELQVDETKIENRVRFEATRILVHVITHRDDALEFFGRKQDVLDCLEFLINSEFVILIKEGLEAITALVQRKQVDTEFVARCKAIAERQKGIILNTDELNIKMNKELLEQVDAFLLL